LWHDSTWHCFMQLDFHEFKIQYPLLWEWDRRVLHRCDLIVFAADWVRDATLTNYEVDPNKVTVAVFGANVESRSRDEVNGYIGERDREPCQLTFVGVDWERKGLPSAYLLANKLNSEGIPTVLNVIGTTHQPKSEERRSSIQALLDPRLWKRKRVNNLGFLGKDDTGQCRQLYDMLARSHFLAHPAHFECFGIALAEANAFGVPVLATDQYGPKTIIRNGINGQLFAPCDFVDHACSYVAEHMRLYENYEKLARSAFSEYQTRLNWDVSVKHLIELIDQLPRRSLSVAAGS
jgi:glycosyltransferase involved in cell wall biosynthesis